MQNRITAPTLCVTAVYYNFSMANVLALSHKCMSVEVTSQTVIQASILFPLIY